MIVGARTSQGEAVYPGPSIPRARRWAVVPTGANRVSDRFRRILEFLTPVPTRTDVTMNTPPLRLAFGAVLGRLFLVTFAIQQFIAFQKTRHSLRSADAGRRFLAFLEFTPYALVLALLVAALVTVALDLLVRFAGRALAAYWYNPPRTGRDLTPLTFTLAPHERVLGEAPARRRSSQGWRAGTLVLTNARLTFFPLRWDVDPWALPMDELRRIRVEPSRAVLGSLIEGVPGRLVVRGADAREALFALADPERVLEWFGESATAVISSPARPRVALI